MVIQWSFFGFRIWLRRARLRLGSDFGLILAEAGADLAKRNP